MSVKIKNLPAVPLPDRPTFFLSPKELLLLPMKAMHPGVAPEHAMHIQYPIGPAIFFDGVMWEEETKKRKVRLMLHDGVPKVLWLVEKKFSSTEEARLYLAWYAEHYHA